MISHRRFFSSAGLFAILLLSWLPAIAQTATQREKPGTISGRVVNEGGRPLANARVMLRRGTFMEPGNLETTTDREGRFEVSGLQPVDYQISAYLEGYVPL